MYLSLTGQVFLKNNVSTIIPLNKNNNSFISSYTQFMFIFLKNVILLFSVCKPGSKQVPTQHLVYGSLKTFLICNCSFSPPPPFLESWYILNSLLSLVQISQLIRSIHNDTGRAEARDLRKLHFLPPILLGAEKGNANAVL